MKTTYTIKPLKWRATKYDWGTVHEAQSIGSPVAIHVNQGCVDGYCGPRIYSGPSVEAAKKACERAYQRELKRALQPVKNQAKNQQP